MKSLGTTDGCLAIDAEIVESWLYAVETSIRFRFKVPGTSGPTTGGPEKVARVRESRDQLSRARCVVVPNSEAIVECDPVPEIQP